MRSAHLILVRPTDRQPRPAGSRGRAARRAGAGLGALGVTAGLLLVGAPGAAAHDRLVSSTPAVDDTLDAVPAEAVLSFSSEVQELGTVAELHDADGEVVGEAVSAVDGRDVVLALPEDLPGGEYDLVYRVTSSDGHPISGEIPFTLDVATPATTPTPAATASPSPTSTAPAPTATTTTTPTTGADDATEPTAAATADDGSGLGVGTVVGVLALAVVGVLAALAHHRRRAAGR